MVGQGEEKAVGRSTRGVNTDVCTEAEQCGGQGLTALFKSSLHPLAAVQLWASCLTSLPLDFLI